MNDRHIPNIEVLKPQSVRSFVGISSIVITVIMIFYLLSFCSTLYWYDSAEFATAGYLLGISHPTGYPTYLTCLKVFLLVPFFSKAFLANFFSLFCACIVFLLMNQYFHELRLSSYSRGFAFIFLAATPVFWSQAIIAEVYLLNLIFFLLILWCEIVAKNRSDMRYYFTSSLLLGLGLGNHLTLIFIAPSMLYNRFHFIHNFIRKTRNAHSFTPKIPIFLSICFLFFILGLSTYLYLPIRAQSNPGINIGDPDSLEEFVKVVRGGYFYKYITYETKETLSSKLSDASLILKNQFELGGLVLVLSGLFIAFRRKETTIFSLLSVSILTFTFVTFYGVDDIEQFSTPLLLVCTIFSSYCVEYLILSLSRIEFKRKRTSINNFCRIEFFSKKNLLFSVLFLTLLYKMYLLFPEQNRSDFNEAEKFIKLVHESLPENSFIINKMSPRDWRLIAPLWYARFVDKRRFDITYFDDVGYWKIQRGSPPFPFYVFTDDPVLHGRYVLSQSGPLYEVRSRKITFPAEDVSSRSVMIDLTAVTNSDFRHDPFTPNPEIGPPYFFPHLQPGIIHWFGVPFLINAPYAESLIPSVLTTCFQKDTSYVIPLFEEETDELWFLLDGGLQRHKRARIAEFIVETVSGEQFSREIQSFSDVWEYFNYKNDYPIPPERCVYGEMENVSLSAFHFPFQRHIVPKNLIVKTGDYDEKIQWFPGITVFAVTQITTGKNQHLQPIVYSEKKYINDKERQENVLFVTISHWGNADYRHDPFIPNPEVGKNIYPELIAGIYEFNAYQFRIESPYDISLKPPVLCLADGISNSITLGVENKFTNELFFVYIAMNLPPLKHTVLTIRLLYLDGSSESTVLLSQSDIFSIDAQNTQNLITKVPGAHDLRYFTCEIDSSKKLREIAVVLNTDKSSPPPIITIFAITQIVDNHRL